MTGGPTDRTSLPAAVSASPAPADTGEEVGYLHAVLAQCGLPRNPLDARTFIRSNGSASLRLEAGSWYNGREWIDQPLPSGTRPRLTLIHACSEAVRTRSRDIDVEHSVRAFLRRLGIDQDGRSMKNFRGQVLALASCRMQLGYRTAEKVVNAKVDPVEQFEAWLTNEDNQRAMWPGVLKLSEPFYRTLIEHSVPLDQRGVASLQNSALALDVYTWLAHRLCRIKQPAGLALSWGSLKDQFGQEYRSEKDFRRELVKALTRVLAVYDDAKVEKIRGGLKLKHSRPPIARKIHVVPALPPKQLPAPAALPKFVTETALDKVRTIAPGWDRQYLLATYLDWRKAKPEPTNIDAAFLGWAKSFTKGKPPV